MKMSELADFWSELGKNDARWGVLTDPNKKGNGWSQDEFYATGEADISDILHRLRTVKALKSHDRALDFGCGVGRLTFALAKTFQRVDGVDIAPTMIDAARAHNASGGHCFFHCNQTGDLALFKADSFDLIISLITLQHMQRKFALRYIREFARVLRPGGCIVFQVPAELDTTHRENILERREKPPLAKTVYKAIRRVIMLDWKPKIRPKLAPAMEMHGISPNAVLSQIEKLNLRVASVTRDDKCGPRWISYTYIVEKNDPADASDKISR